MQRPELFDELDAFDPKWAEHYDTTEQAARAAGQEVLEMYLDHLRNDAQARRARDVDVDWLEVSRRQIELRRQEVAEANSSKGGPRG